MKKKTQKIKAKILTIIASVLFVNISSSQIVGKLVNSNPVLTANPGIIIQNLQNYLATNAGLQVSFNSVNIVNTPDCYLIVFTGPEWASKLPLTVDANNNISAGKISCTTKACSQTDGCVPNWLGTKCSACTGDCTKTTSSGFMLDPVSGN